MPKIDSFIDFDFNPYKLPIIYVYKHPSEFPDYYVARLFDVDERTSVYMLRTNLGEIRKNIPLTFYRTLRDPSDDPEIQEVWL